MVRDSWTMILHLQPLRNCLHIYILVVISRGGSRNSLRGFQILGIFKLTTKKKPSGGGVIPPKPTFIPPVVIYSSCMAYRFYNLATLLISGALPWGMASHGGVIQSLVRGVDSCMQQSWPIGPGVDPLSWAGG